MTKKIFMDCEFSGLHKNTTLISIGLITDDGKSFYAELNDYDHMQVESDTWLLENVVDNLKFNDHKCFCEQAGFGEQIQMKNDNKGVGDSLRHWIENLTGTNSQEKIELWSDCYAYDIVLFNHLFEHAFKIPKNIYYIPFDLSTAFLMKGIDPDISREDFAGLDSKDEKHNALWDAKVIKACYENLMRK